MYIVISMFVQGIPMRQQYNVKLYIKYYEFEYNTRSYFVGIHMVRLAASGKKETPGYENYCYDV